MALARSSRWPARAGRRFTGHRQAGEKGRDIETKVNRRAAVGLRIDGYGYRREALEIGGDRAHAGRDLGEPEPASIVGHLCFRNAAGSAEQFQPNTGSGLYVPVRRSERHRPVDGDRAVRRVRWRRRQQQKSPYDSEQRDVSCRHGNP